MSGGNLYSCGVGINDIGTVSPYGTTPLRICHCVCQAVRPVLPSRLLVYWGVWVRCVGVYPWYPPDTMRLKNISCHFYVEKYVGSEYLY